jgi:uncharacterized protein
LEQSKISVQVQPGASKNKIMSFQDGVWRIRIAAPPVEGKANKQLIQFLSDCLGIPKSSITVDKGQTSKRKIVAVLGMNEEAVQQRLQSCANLNQKLF